LTPRRDDGDRGAEPSSPMDDLSVGTDGYTACRRSGAHARSDDARSRGATTADHASPRRTQSFAVHLTCIGGSPPSRALPPDLRLYGALRDRRIAGRYLEGGVTAVERRARRAAPAPFRATLEGRHHEDSRRPRYLDEGRPTRSTAPPAPRHGVAMPPILSAVLAAAQVGAQPAVRKIVPAVIASEIRGGNPVGIDDAGRVILHGSEPGDAFSHPFVWEDGTRGTSELPCRRSTRRAPTRTG
jgi:hypothetical protein